MGENWQENVNFGALPPLPNGYRVLQLDSGHYIGYSDIHDREVTPISVNRFDVRRWTIYAALERSRGKE